MSAEALLAAVYESPDDDGPRSVYADYLLQRGDPRGELIASQLAPGRAKPGQRQRERDLLAEHAAEWTSELGIDPVHVTFERGFPAIVATEEPMNFSPAWSTVHTCHTPPHDDRCHVRGLRTIKSARGADIEALARLTKPLAVTLLRCRDPSKLPDLRGWRNVTTPEAREAFVAITVLPELQRLVLEPSLVGSLTNPAWIEWIWKSPCTQRLAEVVIPATLASLGAWLARFATLPVQRLEIDVWSERATITLHRDARLTVLVPRTTRFVLHHLGAALSELAPETVRTLRVLISSKAEYEASTEARAHFEALCRRLRIAVSIEKASK